MARRKSGPESPSDENRKPAREPEQGPGAEPRSEFKREFSRELQLPGRRRLDRITISAASVKGSAYQGAVEAVFAIVIATLLGYWADEHFNTAPRWLITGAVVGFGAFVLRLVRMASLVEGAEPGAKTPGPPSAKGEANGGKGDEGEEHRG